MIGKVVYCVLNMNVIEHLIKKLYEKNIIADDVYACVL